VPSAVAGLMIPSFLVRMASRPAIFHALSNQALHSKREGRAGHSEGTIGVPTDCAAQESTTERLKGGPFAVVFAGAVATCGGLKKIGFIAHGL
jgi:hypothetical protein